MSNNDEPKYKLLTSAEDDGEVFDTWELAAAMAVQKGVARWKRENELQMVWPATIKAVRE